MKGNELITALRAGFAFFFCQVSPSETDKAVEVMVDKVLDFKNRAGNSPYSAEVWDYEKSPDVEGLLFGLDDLPAGTVLFAKNLQWFLTDEAGGVNKLFAQFILNRSNMYTTQEFRKAIVIVSSSGMESIPEEIRSEFLSLTFDLPGPEEIGKQLDFIIESAKSVNPDFETPAPEVRKQIINAAKGMGEKDIRNSFAYTAISDGEINPATVGELKAKNIESVSGLKIGRYSQTFKTLKGYDTVKDFTMMTIESSLAKGVLLLGPPGTGKTCFCRALGNETGRLVLEMEVAQLFGGRVGDSEKLMASAIAAVNANAPCILFIDEIEKALSGMSSSSSSDGGTTERSMAQLLKFLSDGRAEGVYVVATCNNISKIPPEWVRPGRWDSAPFFIDLPNEFEKNAIFEHYKSVFSVTGEVKNDDGWSGAEIESCCRIASMMSITLDEAEKYIVPVSSTMGADITALREWAVGKTLLASKAAPPKTAKKATQGLEI